MINEISMLSPRYFLACFFSPVHYLFFYDSARAGLSLHICLCMQTHALTVPDPASFSHPLFSISYFLLMQSQSPLCSVFASHMPCWCFFPASSNSPVSCFNLPCCQALTDSSRLFKGCGTSGNQGGTLCCWTCHSSVCWVRGNHSEALRYLPFPC